MSFHNTTQIPHFDLNALWEIALAIYDTNPLDPRLFYPFRPLLTYDACVQLNSKGNRPEFFMMSDVLYRFQLWKAPLIQLIAQMQLPPLGWRSRFFVIMHLIGDPLDTIWSLSHKIFLCDRRVEKWSHERDHKALGIVVVSCDEWGKGNEVEVTLLGFVQSRDPVVQARSRNACRKAAQSLSFDRSTSFVPVAVSIVIFFGAIWIAFDKKSLGASTINNGITPYYIAHAALYFSILPAILLSAIIGVSQDRDAIPDILNQLQSDTRDDESEHSRDDEMVLMADFDVSERIILGGIYSWQPKKWEYLISNDGGGCWRWRLIAALSYSSVLSGCLVAIRIAYTAPPTGFGCRETAIISTLGLWMLSGAIDTYAERRFKLEPKKYYAVVFWKDLLCSLLIVVYNVFVYLGMYNRCSCWTKFGSGPLCFALDPGVSEELHEKMIHEWPNLIILLAAWQILFVLVICALSHRGVRLLLFAVRNNSEHGNNEHRFGLQHILFRLRAARPWWRQITPERRFRRKRNSEGDDVELVPHPEHRQD